MKVGLISDVHGDYSALELTLNRMVHEHDVVRVLCAGDLVGRGPEQNRVVDAIRGDDIVTVRGNHDETLYGLTDSNTNFLKDLPIDWRGKIGGRRVFMCHGKPGNNMWGMYRDHLSDTYLSMVLRSLKTDVLVTGHTHVPLYMQVKEGVLVNPGSLYTFHSARETSHSYGVLDLQSLTFELYDSAAASLADARIEYDY